MSLYSSSLIPSDLLFLDIELELNHATDRLRLSGNVIFARSMDDDLCASLLCFPSSILAHAISMCRISRSWNVECRPALAPTNQPSPDSADKSESAFLFPNTCEGAEGAERSRMTVLETSRKVCCRCPSLSMIDYQAPA